MLYMSDSGRVTLWCMLQAGVSNHVSTVGNMFVAGLVCSHCVWRYVCGWAMLYMSDSGPVTLWCMLLLLMKNCVPSFTERGV